MYENILNDIRMKSLCGLGAKIFAVSILMVVILKFKMATIILDESHVCYSF